MKSASAPRICRPTAAEIAAKIDNPTFCVMPENVRRVGNGKYLLTFLAGQHICGLGH